MASPSKLKSTAQPGKTAAATSRSSRRQTLAPMPLEGKSFYLHLQERNTNVKELEGRLRKLGGTIERFLSKDVTCVVTDQVAGKPPQARGTSTVMQGKAQTRTQLMLQRAANQHTTSSTDVLRNAHIWKIDIKPVGRILKWIESQEAKQASNKGLQSRDQERSKGKARMLRGAFIKVEDHSRKYRPLFKELRSWPRLNLDAPPGYSPFDEPVARRTRSRNSPKSPQSPVPWNTAKPRENVQSKRQTPKRGYCELCDVTYESMTSHVNSKPHRSCAAEAASFSGVDRLIERGKSLQEFVADVRSRKTGSSDTKRSRSAAAQTTKRSARTAKDDNNKSRRSATSTQVTTVKTVRYAENGSSVVHAKRTRSDSDDKPSINRPSKRRRFAAVVQSTPTTIHLHRTRRPRSISSK